MAGNGAIVELLRVISVENKLLISDIDRVYNAVDEWRGKLAYQEEHSISGLNEGQQARLLNYERLVRALDDLKRRITERLAQ